MYTEGVMFFYERVLEQNRTDQSEGKNAAN